MPAFTQPGFQQRQDAAARAKNALLAKYRSKPPIDEALVAERAARRIARDAAAAEKREATRRAREEAVEAKLEHQRQMVAAAEAETKAQAKAVAQARATVAAEKAAQRKLWTEEDRKAARDARYAARKMRAGRR